MRARGSAKSGWFLVARAEEPSFDEYADLHMIAINRPGPGERRCIHPPARSSDMWAATYMQETCANTFHSGYPAHAGGESTSTLTSAIFPMVPELSTQSRRQTCMFAACCRLPRVLPRRFRKRKKHQWPGGAKSQRTPKPSPNSHTQASAGVGSPRGSGSTRYRRLTVGRRGAQASSCPAF